MIFPLVAMKVLINNVAVFAGGRIVLSDDKKKLSEYREIQDGTVFRLDLTVVYVQAVNGQKYKIPIGTDKFYVRQRMVMAM